MPVFEVVAGANAMKVDMSEVSGGFKLTAKTLLQGGERFSVNQLIQKVKNGDISNVEAARYAAEQIVKRRYEKHMNSYIENILKS